jgi:deazaflavin-dependent oxidoreductase (nitroreductase family)
MDWRTLKRRIVHPIQRRVVNPVGRQLPFTMIETTGRRSGQPRRTAIGGRVVGNRFWMVSEHGEHSHYVLNIKADPRVRLRIRRRWRVGTAHLLYADDPIARLRQLPALNSSVVRMVGSELLTIRVDMEKPK